MIDPLLNARIASTIAKLNDAEKDLEYFENHRSPDLKPNTFTQTFTCGVCGGVGSYEVKTGWFSKNKVRCSSCDGKGFYSKEVTDYPPIESQFTHSNNYYTGLLNREMHISDLKTDLKYLLIEQEKLQGMVKDT